MRYDTKEETSLPPATALHYLQSGAMSPEHVFSALDVDACHFTRQIDEQGTKPLIETGNPSYTEPSTGFLACSMETVNRNKAEGKKSVLVIDYDNRNSDSGLFTKADGLIFLRFLKNGDKSVDDYFSHFLTHASEYSSALLDDFSNPQITMLEDRSGIKLCNGQILHEGTLITIDPVNGKLWDKELPILSPNQTSQMLVEYLSHIEQSPETPEITTHTIRHNDFKAVFDAQRKMVEEYRKGGQFKQPFVGLYRTDIDCSNFLTGEDKEFFTDLSNGAVPLKMKSWDSHEFMATFPINYRLPDLHNMRNVLPQEFADTLEKGQDHKFGTPLFKFRENLYWQQLTNVFRETSGMVSNNKSIIVPSIVSGEEVAHFKEIVERTIPEELKNEVKFGVMIETEESLKNIADIARQCDCLCIGTNGLTEKLTGLDRSVLNHSKWMTERGYEGRSPFEVFVPEVTGPLTEALKIAKEVNPNISINFCGHQVAGHDAKSIQAAIDMGADQITVPLHEENYYRAKLAIAQHAARNGLLNIPQFENDCLQPEL